MDGDEREVGGGEGLVHALLQERLGGERAPELCAQVLARHAAGEGVGAAARLAAAAPGEGGRSRWLAAALVLLGIGVVVAVAVMRHQGDVAQVPVQQPEDPQGQDRSGSKVPEVVPVQSLEQLKELLPQVIGMSMQVSELPFPGCDYRLPDRGPFPCSVDDARSFASHLAADARATEPAGWEWGDSNFLLLRDGRAIAFAIAPGSDLPDRNRRRAGVRGLMSDISLGVYTVGLLDKPAADTAWAAQIANGLVCNRSDLQPENLRAFADRESLKLLMADGVTGAAALRGGDLANLTTLPKLRRLDLSGQGWVDGEALRQVSKLQHIDELILDNFQWDDEALEQLCFAHPLRLLSLRHCMRIQGSVFDTFKEAYLEAIIDEFWRAVEIVDLSQCGPLQVVMLPMLNPKELRLADTPLPETTAHGDHWLPIRSFDSRLEVLDLSGHALTASRLRELTGFPQLRELTLDRCQLTDNKVTALAQGKAPISVLRLGGNPGVSLAAAKTLLQALPTLQEIDLRAADERSSRHVSIECGPGKRIWTRDTDPQDAPSTQDTAQDLDLALIQVQSLDELKQLLAQATGLSMGWLRLPTYDMQVPAGTPPYRASSEVAKLVATRFASSLRGEPTASTGQPMCWFRFELADGRALRLELVWDDTLEKQKRARLVVPGLSTAVSVGEMEQGLSKEQERVLEEAAVESVLAAQQSLGVVMPIDLGAERITAFRDCESLRVLPTWLFSILTRIGVDELARLAQLPKLKRLDLSRVAGYVPAKGLSELASSRSLEELVLDGCRIDDADLATLGQMPNLKALSLRGCTNLKGTAFDQTFQPDAQPPDPFQKLEHLDLSDCPSLLGSQWVAFAMLPALTELRLANAPAPIPDIDMFMFLRGVQRNSRLTQLDLSGRELRPEFLKELAEAGSLSVLVLCNCDLDADDLKILLASKSLQRLCVGDNPVTASLAAMSDEELCRKYCQRIPDTWLLRIDLRTHAAAGYVPISPSVSWITGVEVIR